MYKWLRTNDGTNTYQYYYCDGDLVCMFYNGIKMSFSYTPDGLPYTIVYDGTQYLYITNLQGDVTAIIKQDGTLLVEYAYDAWGNVLSVTGSMADTLGQLNPLRYRGYTYDRETGLYYLQSRYYDPELGRFINADAFTSTGQGILGNNMYAYCANNPVSREDDSGAFWSLVAGAAIGGAISGSIISATSYLVSCGINGDTPTLGGVLGAVATGAFSGAIGGVIGAFGGTTIKLAGAAIVGAVNGIVTAINTNGTVGTKLCAGVAAGIITGFGTYTGTKIPAAKDSAFTTAVTAFAGGLMVGAPTEIVNVIANQGIKKAASQIAPNKPIFDYGRHLRAERALG